MDATRRLVRTALQERGPRFESARRLCQICTGFCRAGNGGTRSDWLLLVRRSAIANRRLVRAVRDHYVVFWRSGFRW
jgi:hypothetical protein